MTKGWTAFSVWCFSGNETEKKKVGSRSIYIWVLFSDCTKLESLKAAVQEWILQMWEASRHCWKDIMARAVKTKLKPVQYWTTLSVQNATHSINNEIPLESCFLPHCFCFFQIQMTLLISIYQKENCLPPSVQTTTRHCCEDSQQYQQSGTAAGEIHNLKRLKAALNFF